MIIRHVIHTEEDLRRRFSQRFVERWQALVRLYRMKYRMMDGVNVMKVASIAFAFFGAAVDGDAVTGCHFDESLHDGSIEIDGERFVVGGDDDCRGMLMWDAACLMLEERDLSGSAQWAYDEADRHDTYAYRLDAAEGGVTCTQGGVKVVGADVERDVKDKVELEFVMSYLAANVRKSVEQRHQIKCMVMDMLFMKNIDVPDDVRMEIVHYDDVGDIRVEAIRDLLSLVTHVTIVDNRGTYIGNQNKYL